MRIGKYALSWLALVFACLGNPGMSAAQTLPTPTCAWQGEWSPFGLANWFAPDAGNRWFYMPIDPQWESMTISGAYPRARFFSIATYDNAPVSTGLAGRLYDAQIIPDPGSVNPFAPPAPPGANGTYTIAVTRGKAPSKGNVIPLHAKTGWLVYRLYLPNAGQGSMAGVPLPSISITVAGQTKPLPVCQFINRQSQVAALQPWLVPPALETPPVQPPVPDLVMFGPIPSPPAVWLPNPENKYMVSYFMPAYEPGRILVIRGKMPAFPNTYHGRPVWEPAPGFKTVQLRYWSMCLTDFVSPLPVDGCAVDAGTPLDKNGFYTVVISNDALRPDWLSPDDVWIAWGDEKMVPKVIFARNTLPSPDFNQSVKNAIEHGCGVDFVWPNPPSQGDIKKAGICAQKVMGDYYPAAVWCSKPDFRRGGWRACF